MHFYHISPRELYIVVYINGVFTRGDQRRNYRSDRRTLSPTASGDWLLEATCATISCADDRLEGALSNMFLI